MNPLWELVARAAEQHGEAPAVHTLERTYSFVEVERIAQSLAAELREQGLRPGDLVATALPNSLDWFFVLACAHEGLLSVSVYTPQQARDLGANLFVAREGAVGDTDGLNVLEVDAHWLRARESTDDTTPAREYGGPESLARLVLTSGTTGKAKAAEYSVGTFQARLDNAERLWNLGTGNRINFLGVSTMGGLSQGMLSSWAGAPFFAIDAITSAVPTIITEFDVTLLLGSTVTLAQVADACAAMPGSGKSVSQILIGGSVPSDALLLRLAEVFPARVQVLYGSTEGGVITARIAEIGADARNVGVPFPGVQVDILDESGNDVEPGTIGEIRYRSAEIVKRYYRDPEATAESLRDGYFYPGDRGYFTGGGELVIAGRIDDVLNIGGTKIDPLTLESVALAITGVTDAAAYEITGTDGRPAIEMALVTDSDDVMRDVDARIRVDFPQCAPASYRRVSELPRNFMGKLNRDNLVAIVRGDP